jgi:hypothetical protein
MCDYSMQFVASRPAKVGEKLVTTRFPNSTTRGLSAVGEPTVAVCLLPGTEVAFEKDVEYSRGFGFLPDGGLKEKVARFRQIDNDKPDVHHDALDFPGGQIVLIAQLCEGQRLVVLQLPVISPATTNADRGSLVA